MSDLPKPSLQFDFKKILKGILPDKSGNNLNGTVNKGCTIVEDSVMGSCLSFDGNDGFVSIPSMPESGSWNLSQGITLSAWIYCSQFNLNARILDFGNGTAKNNIVLFAPNNSGNIVYENFNDSSGWASSAGIQLTMEQWTHIAFTVDQNGKVTSYQNGILLKSDTGSQALPQSLVRSSNLIGKSNWQGDEFFQGKMAWLSVYNQALSQEQIMADMLQGEENRSSSFRKSFPVEFKVYSRNQDDDVPVLYIEDAGQGKELYFDILNNSTQALNVPQASGTASDTNYHFQLRFRPGTLSDNFLKQNSPSIDNWSMTVGSDSTTGVDFISFLRTDNSLTLGAGGNNRITIPSVNANPLGGARNTNVECLYNGITLGAQTSTVKGSRLQSLSIVSHVGQKDIPLYVGVVGNPTILNDGQTMNSLLIGLRNVGNKEIPLSTDMERPTTFTIEVRGQSDQDLLEFAMLETSNLNGLQMNWPVIGRGKMNKNWSDPQPDNMLPKAVVVLDAPATTNCPSDNGVNMTSSSRDGAFRTAIIGGKFLGLESGDDSFEYYFELRASVVIEEGAKVTDRSTNQVLGTVKYSGLPQILSLSWPLETGLKKGTKLFINFPSGTALEWAAGQGSGYADTFKTSLPSGNRATATVYEDCVAGATQLTVLCEHCLMEESLITQADTDDWEVIENTGEESKIVWKVTNKGEESVTVGGGLSFCLSNIVSGLANGTSSIVIGYYNVPDYWDGQFVVSVNRSPFFIAEDGVGINTVDPSKTLDVNGNLQADQILISADNEIPLSLINTVQIEGAAPGYPTGTEWSFQVKQMNTQLSNSKTWPQYGLQIADEKNVAISFWNGKVGIGTPTPDYPLELGSSAGSYSIMCAGKILAEKFDTSSDLRIKRIKGRSLAEKDLQLLNQVKVTDYDYIDQRINGTKKGVIAQELAKVFPEAVNKIREYIPDIHIKAKDVYFNESIRTLTLKLPKSHDLVPGDWVRIFVDQQQTEREVLTVLDSETFIIGEWDRNNCEVFVFGKQVDDFHCVNYSSISMLGISAIQHLSQEVETLKKEKRALEDQLQHEVKSLKDEIAEMKNSIAIKPNQPLN